MSDGVRSEGLATALRALPLQSFRAGTASVLASAAGLPGAVVRLVDYTGEQLWLFAGTHVEPVVPVTGSAEGTAFREQRVHHTDSVVHLPISCRGNRLGVLSTDLADLGDAGVTELGEIADVLADALQVANIGTDELVRTRRGDRMTVAAEIQWELLPGRELHAREFALAGQLRPAYHVRGDNFDWSLDPGVLTFTATNGLGEGLDAALLTATAIAALRNARRSGAGLVDQASLAGQAVWSQFGGKQHVSALLVTVELATGRLAVIDAGSPRMWRQRDGRADPVDLDPQLPLGMFADTTYRVQTGHLAAGDRLVVVSDGVYACTAAERSYAEHALPRVLIRSRALSPAEVVRAVLSDLHVFRDHEDLDDDALVVCLDWLGG